MSSPTGPSPSPPVATKPPPTPTRQGSNVPTSPVAGHSSLTSSSGSVPPSSAGPSSGPPSKRVGSASGTRKPAANKDPSKRAKKFNVFVNMLTQTQITISVSLTDTIAQVKQKVEEEQQRLDDKARDERERERKKEEQKAAKQQKGTTAGTSSSSSSDPSTAATRKSRASTSTPVPSDNKEDKKESTSAPSSESKSGDANANGVPSTSGGVDGELDLPRGPQPDVGGMRLAYNGLELDNALTINDYGEIDKDSVLDQLPPESTTGRAKFKWPNTGAEYDGEWALFEREKKRHGQGRYTVAGETYIGEWNNDMITGKGKYSFASGATYEGQWYQGKFHGRGTYTWALAPNSRPGTSPPCYIGEWRDNKMHGQGIFVAATGDRFQGTFHNDRFLNENGYWIAPQAMVDRPLAQDPAA